MKITCSFLMIRLAPVWVMVALLISPARGAIEDPTAPRDWRAYGGHTLNAAFVGLKGNAVGLKGEDGVIRSVPLNLLVPEDQAVARELAERMASGGLYAIKQGTGNKLSVFAEGPGKGLFALYTNEIFVVRVRENASITVQCLEAGKPAGKPIGVGMGFTYIPESNPNPHARKIASFDKPFLPMLQPEVITLSGLLEGNAKFVFNLAIEENTLHVWAWVEDPPDIKPPTLCTPGFAFARTHSFAAHVLVADQKEAVKDYSVEVDPLDGKAFTLPYGDTPKGREIRGPLRSMAFKGPVFGSRRVSVNLGPSRNGALRLDHRGHSPLFGGFALRLGKEDPAFQDETCRISLMIE